MHGTYKRRHTHGGVSSCCPEVTYFFAPETTLKSKSFLGHTGSAGNSLALGGGEAKSPRLRSMCLARAVSLRLVLGAGGAGGAGRGFWLVVVDGGYGIKKVTRSCKVSPVFM